MTDVTAKMVMALRDRTGVGMMDCKKALIESGGDEEKAIEWLRTRGLAKAAAKAERTAKDGLIRIHKDDDRHGSMLMLNCETDFVANTDDFKELIDTLAAFMALAQISDSHLGKVIVGETLDVVRDLDHGGRTVSETITETVSRTGENIQLGSVVVERSEAPEDYLQGYLHGSRVGVLVCLTTGKPGTHGNPRFLEAAKDVAMQIAAGVPVVPQAVRREDVDPALVEKESAFLIEQAKAEGKSQEIAEKMVVGRMGKFFGEICLLEQPFIKDDKQTVGEMLKAVETELGDTVGVARFHRFQLGE